MSLFTRSYDIHNKIINVSISSVPMSNKIQQNRIYVYIPYFKSYSISNVGIGKWHQVVSYILNAKPCISLSSMMTSSNGNIFRVTGHLWRVFTGCRWIPGTKASDAELWRNGWVNNHEAGYLRRHCTHYDVAVMYHSQLNLLLTKFASTIAWSLG